jgi:hypothetical protein
MYNNTTRGIPKVAGSIPTVVRQTFQPARCGYTLKSNIRNIIFTWVVHNVKTHTNTWHNMPYYNLHAT